MVIGKTGPAGEGGCRQAYTNAMEIRLNDNDWGSKGLRFRCKKELVMNAAMKKKQKNTQKKEQKQEVERHVTNQPMLWRKLDSMMMVEVNKG